MKTIFSTLGEQAETNFQLWRDFARDRLMPAELYRVDDGVFRGLFEGTDLGSLLITRSTFSAVRVESTPSTLRRNAKRDTLAVTIKLSGTSSCEQFGRQATVQPGEIMVLDRANPSVRQTSGSSRSLLLEIPRARLENLLGDARHFSALTVGADLGSAKLVTTFLDTLLRVENAFTPDAAKRMSAIAVDLIAASVAERLAKEVPKPLHGTVVVQRAKAYVEAHLGDSSLDPPKLATAVGVSLRRLQELFKEQGQHISDWIWQRRLETAAKRLTDQGCRHLSIGVLAFGCGFASQAHFSRRFRDRYGMAPSDFRHLADAADPKA
ncbi:helix-turn-helix domain-containing protein [Methylobacterium sp. E-066]|uniref:helix-turn-helix domain-containing protein n=1 Tax=Methylobacterium sp. E-066 TaxID=2836584 RepID=UPI001FB99E74|nr:helix-turn-helix domain-containing protein [Methylobacterium sp. E-066]MCJ2141620.1 helix-turn-helix domain-containing protein [Methylobacterium sp. E-066]